PRLASCTSGVRLESTVPYFSCMLAKIVRASMRVFCEDSTATKPAPVDAVAAEASFFGTGVLAGADLVTTGGAFLTGATGSAAAGGGILAADATLTGGCCCTALTGGAAGGGSWTRAAEGGAWRGS